MANIQLNPSADTNTNLQVIFDFFQNTLAVAEKSANDRHTQLVTNLKSMLSVIIADQVKLRKENEQLKCEVLSLRQGLSELQQQSLEKNLIINGVAEVEKSPSDTSVLVNGIFTALGVQLNSDDVIEVQRLGKNIDPAKKRPILVKLRNVRDKRKIITAKREMARKNKVQLNCSQLNLVNVKVGGVNDLIYINEDLSQHNSQLYSEARQLKKSGVFQFTWVNEGVIFVRKKEKMPAHRIYHVSDLKKISAPVLDSEMENAYEAGENLDHSTKLLNLII